MELHQQLFVQPVVEHTLLAAANTHARGRGASSVNSVLVNRARASRGVHFNHVLNPFT